MLISGIRAQGIKQHSNSRFNHQSRKPAMDEKRQRKEDQKERKRKKQRLLFLVVAQEHRTSWRYGDSRPVNSGIRAKGIKTTQQFMINHQSRKPAMDEKRQRKEDQKERKRKKQRLLFLVVAQEHRTCSSEFKRRDEPI
ncbi:hypothetical protein Tco_0928235 [Tanacetum coccineum]